MRVLFLTFAPLSSGAGHLARFVGELGTMSEKSGIGVLCLGAIADSDLVTKAFPGVSFFHVPASFRGWDLQYADEVVKEILKVREGFCADLLVLQMEVWDLMRELGVACRGRLPVAVVCHAMPFLGAPLQVSGDFEKDVQKHLRDETLLYRKEYILQHFLEVDEVFRNVYIIANNKTVAYSLKAYFPDLEVLEQKPSLIAVPNSRMESSEEIYDFVYMARMEKGKGVEYLADVLTEISKLLLRPVSIAIMGRADDEYSAEFLNRLLAESEKSAYFRVKYLGWCDDVTKQAIFSQSTVFLYPSHYDNYPTVVNEALAFGLPVVVWDVLFSRLNYSGTNVVLRADFMNISAFAQAAKVAFRNKQSLRLAAKNYAKGFPSQSECAGYDLELFSYIVKKGSL